MRKNIVALLALAGILMAQIVVIQGTDSVSGSRTTINNNFAWLASQLGGGGAGSGGPLAVVTTIAGTPGSSGSIDGNRSTARFNQIRSIKMDPYGNLWTADFICNTIREINVTTGAVTTIAGGGGSCLSGNLDGTGSAARFSDPTDITFDSAGNLYITDTGNGAIRKMTQAGVVTTFAPTDKTSGDLLSGIAYGPDGNIYFNDYAACVIGRINPTNPNGSGWDLIAGTYNTCGEQDGTGTSKFYNPSGMGFDSAGNLWVVDEAGDGSPYGGTVRRISSIPTIAMFDGTAIFVPPTVLTVAGSIGAIGTLDGTGTAAGFNIPSWLAIDRLNNLYITDFANSTVRKVTPAGVVTTIAGVAAGYACCAGIPPLAQTNVDGNGDAARFNFTDGIAIDSSGNLYIADRYDYTIRKIAFQPNNSTMFQGRIPESSMSGLGHLFQMHGGPQGVAGDYGIFGKYGDIIDAGPGASAAPNSITSVVSPAITAEWTAVTTFAGTPGQFGHTNATGTAARFGSNGLKGMAVDPSGNVYGYDTGNGLIRKVTSAGVVTDFAGTYNVLNGHADGGLGTGSFNYASGIKSDSSGNIWVADTSNCELREVSPSGVITTITGQWSTCPQSTTVDGPLASATFGYIADVVVSSSGTVYFTSYSDCTVKEITGGAVTTIAGTRNACADLDGTGTAATFDRPNGITMDSAGNLYIGEEGYSTVRKVLLPSVVVTTLAGVANQAGCPASPGPSYQDGIGAAALFNCPGWVASDGSNIYVSDGYNYAVRKITPAGLTTTLMGGPSNQGSADGTGVVAQFNSGNGPEGIAATPAGLIYVSDRYNGTIRKLVQGVPPLGVGVIPASTIAHPLQTPLSGQEVRFTDAANATDCTVGGGLAMSVCMWNGTAWQKP